MKREHAATEGAATKRMRAWIGRLVSRLRRLFRVTAGGDTARSSPADRFRNPEKARDQRPDSPASLHPVRKQAAISSLAIKESEAEATEPGAHRGLKADRPPGKEVAPSGPPNAEATASASSHAPHSTCDTSEALEDEGVPSTIADNLVRPGHAREPVDREPGSVVPDSPPPHPRPEAHMPETEVRDVTASASPVESADFEGPENLDEPGRPIPERDPTADHVAGGTEFDTPTSPPVPGAAARPDSEMAATSRSSVPQARQLRRVAPENRGGRPRGTDGLADEAASAAPTGEGDVARSRSPRPELVCWKEGMAWVVGVEVPDELAEQDLRVLDGEDKDLEKDQLHELRWRLTDPLGPVTVRWSDEAAIEAERCFDASKYRVFKVARSGVNGRGVSRVTRGNYIVIAPGALTRDEVVGGRAPIAPENVIPEQAGILAHHLLVQGETDVLVLDQGGTARVEVRPSTATAYKLLGHRIEDAHTGAGPLFAREPPRFCVEGVAEPALFVVGVEGPSPGRRSRQAATSFDEVRTWLDDKQPGWFFVRAYDATDELLESLDFRYAKGLEAIEIDEHSPLPGPQGHRPVKVVLRVAPGVVVSPLDGPAMITPFELALAEGVFFLAARPDAGRATWRLRSETGDGVDVVVHAPRVWWAFTADGDEEKPHAWTDGFQTLSTDDLLPTSPMRLSVLLPEPGWADEVLVGLRDGSPRRVPVPRTERVLHYPLRNLGEDDALRRADGPCDLLMSVRTRATEHGPVVVGAVRLTADRLPERERDRRLDLSYQGAPRLMSQMTRLGRLGTAHRRAVKELRKTWYQKARRGGPTEAREFIRQALALAAAILDHEPTRRLSSRWNRRAQLLAGLDPTAVASWQRRLRASGSRGGRMAADAARGEARRA